MMSYGADRRDMDAELLGSIEGKLTIIRDFARGVAQGALNGLYLWGPGGTSKSHTVRETLERAEVAPLWSNSRITAKALFELLRDHRDRVHVLDDVGTLL